MAWLLSSLFLVTLLELLSSALSKGSLQKLLAYICMVFIVFNSFFIMYYRPSVWAGFLLYFSVFRVINLFKLVDSRKQIDFLRSSYIRSSISLAALQGLVLFITYLINASGISYGGKWVVVAASELVGLLTIAMSLRRTTSKTRPKLSLKASDFSKLPALSVAIPARNETDDLEECLNGLVKSNYPKLEILVLDDCSQEKRTPEIIRQFAHEGVRFVGGSTPNDSWTAKNYAYQQLYEEASGEVILFCGVDARFEEQTLTKMVELKLDKNKTMMSFMPLNHLQTSLLKSVLIQPIRYLWELGLPRRSLNRPPVLSTCWLIDAKTLRENGTFKAVSRTIVPERYFARKSALNNDGYSFVCLGSDLGFTTQKAFKDQLDTAVRTSYPALRQRLEDVSIVSLAEAALFAVPIGLFIYELMNKNWLVVSFSLINVVIASIIFFVANKFTYSKSPFAGIFALPVVFIYDIGVRFYSMWQYEFSQVVWKGRNVCIPVMGVLNKLQ